MARAAMERGLRLTAWAFVLCALPAHAKTGNFLPMLLSFLFAIPALLLVPVIALACGRQEWKRKLPWVLASLAVAILSFASLWWATKTHALLANADWPVIYLWIVPAWILWPIARNRLKDAARP